MKVIFFLFYFVLSSILNEYVAAQTDTLDARISYNQGIDFYKKKDYNKAEDNFLKALNTENNRLEQWASFNLGNVNFEKALNLEDKDPTQGLSIYKNALELFRRAIDFDDKDTDAKYNFELTAKKIKKLEQKVKQQKEQKQSAQKEKQEGPQEEKKEQPIDQEKQEADTQKEKEASAQIPKEKVPPEQGEQKQNKQAEQSPKRQEMTKQEALMILENFQQAEKERRELLQKEKQDQEPPVEKDW